MSILNRYQGFEELEMGGPAAGEVAAAGVEDSVRAEVAEVQVVLEQQSQEIEELREEVKQQDEAVEEIQEVVEGLESLISSGQFNSTAFANMYNRAAKLNTKLGGVAVERCGVESMSDAATAQIMARSGMEGFMESVKGYAKKAIEVIKHIFNTVINFFVGLFSAAEKLSRRHDQLAARVTAAEKVKEKIKLGGWNVLFDYEKGGLNKDPEGWTATKGALASFAGVAKSASKVDLSSFNSAYASLLAAIKKDAKSDVNAGEKSEGDKKTLIGMSAGVRIHAEMKDGLAKDLKEAAEMARSIKIFFGTGDTSKLTSGEVAAKADKGALTAALGKVKATVTAIRNDKVAAAFSKSQRDQVIGSLNVLKADDKEKSEEVNAQIQVVRAVYAASSSVAQAVNKQVIRSAGWTLDAVAAHV